MLIRKSVRWSTTSADDLRSKMGAGIFLSYFEPRDIVSVLWYGNDTLYVVATCLLVQWEGDMDLGASIVPIELQPPETIPIHGQVYSV